MKLWRAFPLLGILAACQGPGLNPNPSSDPGRLMVESQDGRTTVTGYEGTLQLVAKDAAGNLLDPAKISWSARSLGGIGGVDPQGVVTGAGDGVVEVVAHGNGLGDSLPFSVQVQGTRPVLITGGYNRSSNDTNGLFYLVNGTYHEVSVPEDIGWQSNLTCGDIHSGRVLVAGKVYLPTGQAFFYWDNDVRHLLSDADSVTQATIDGKSVYVLGTSGGQPCYWVDGVRVDLVCPSGYRSPLTPPQAPPGLIAKTLSLKVENGVVKVSALVNQDNAAAGYPSKVCLWTDGTPQVFDTPDGYSVKAASFSGGGTDLLADYDTVTKVYHQGVWTSLAPPQGLPESATWSGSDVLTAGGLLLVTGVVNVGGGPNAVVWVDKVPYFLQNDNLSTIATQTICPGNKLMTIGYRTGNFGKVRSARFWYDGDIVPFDTLVDAEYSWFSYLVTDSVGP